ncbi:DUF4198 domain-containing protein [Roseobacter sp. YSTF-M11]|uniref:DUF4198 domain-containing protein n=1 Tax=Roseobacter insulae TaxID=2859783 RepID=A0A9X1FTM5_9RHOB|nr:DUF4198 domain-containing protein [Roseobacter insulae]MBW4707437.1 DUF4198 domain-containing protein [Roseobacter insulae]
MSRYLAALLLVMLAMSPARAHDFWLEPDSFRPMPGSALTVTVRIGEALDGQSYPFDPRAYKYALWSGPKGDFDLSLVPVRARQSGMVAIGDGLHSLTVASYDQALTHDTTGDLLHFLTSVGQADLVATDAGRDLPTTNISERYRRSSKLLVHFGSVIGVDRRIGADREWVALGSGFRLFDGPSVAGHHPVQVHCRQRGEDRPVTRQDLKTDAEGVVHPRVPRDGECLLNAVFIGFDGAESDLTSEWVSLFLHTEPAAGAGEFSN